MISEPTTSAEFAEELLAFDRAEAARPSPKGAALFYGGSSVRLWGSLTEDFAPMTVINRGFGGSTLRECVGEMGRLVLPLAPSKIVLYAGDNDLDQGAKAGDVLRWFHLFVARVRQGLGPVPILYLTVKPSPSRWWNIGEIRRTNALLAEAAQGQPGLHPVDVHAAMLGPDGAPRGELFDADGLHLNPAGYALWTARVRSALEGLGLFP